MKARYEVAKLAPAGYKGLLEIERYLKTCGVEENILHLMKLRASQDRRSAPATPRPAPGWWWGRPPDPAPGLIRSASPSR